jgi:hypothetical protein
VEITSQDLAKHRLELAEDKLNVKDILADQWATLTGGGSAATDAF